MQLSFNKKVIDVSVYQGNIDWQKVKNAGIYAAVLRAGYGRYVKQEDVKFKQNYNGATAVDMPVGVYWFSYAKTAEEAKLEAQVCLQVIDNRELLMPVYFDQEESSIPVSSRTDCAVAFMDYIKVNSKYLVGYYSYTSYMPSIDLNSIQQHCDTIWLADYRSNYNKTIPRDMHQYSQSGSVPGIQGRVDMNNLFRDFPTEIKGGNKPVYNSDTLKIGPASAGDLKTITNLANSLSINVKQENDYLIVGPMSGGDLNTVSNKALELGLGCVDYVEETEPEIPENPDSGDQEYDNEDVKSIKETVEKMDEKVDKMLEYLVENKENNDKNDEKMKEIAKILAK